MLLARWDCWCNAGWCCVLTRWGSWYNAGCVVCWPDGTADTMLVVLCADQMGQLIQCWLCCVLTRWDSWYNAGCVACWPDGAADTTLGVLCADQMGQLMHRWVFWPDGAADTTLVVLCVDQMQCRCWCWLCCVVCWPDGAADAERGFVAAGDSGVVGEIHPKDSRHHAAGKSCSAHSDLYGRRVSNVGNTSAVIREVFVLFLFLKKKIKPAGWLEQNGFIDSFETDIVITDMMEHLKMLTSETLVVSGGLEMYIYWSETDIARNGLWVLTKQRQASGQFLGWKKVYWLVSEGQIPKRWARMEPRWDCSAGLNTFKVIPYFFSARSDKNQTNGPFSWSGLAAIRLKLYLLFIHTGPGVNGWEAG